MIIHPWFPTEPWGLTETALDMSVLGQTESVFALSNGHIGLRGNLDEGEPHALPGSYLNSFFESRLMPYPEGGYGYPEAGQTVVNVTDGKVIRLLVDDEPLDVRYGRLISHRRALDFRTGLLTRELEWESPADRRIRVRSQRLVSLTQRSVAAFVYEVEPVDGRADVVVQSELVANEPVATAARDPRAAAALTAPLVSELHVAREGRAVLVHSTRASRLRVAAAMDHVVSGAETSEMRCESSEDLARLTVATDVEPGNPLRIVKFLSYGWSSERAVPALRDQAEAALASARRRGWEGLAKEQADFLAAFWARADVEIEGDAELQQAVRFALFHVLQAGARGEHRAIPAKGLTGPGYDGHAFWDSESFVLRALTYTAPQAVRDALAWRHSTLPKARDRAKVLGLSGAAFPWRTIGGEECSGYWPAGTAAFHINADIADAVVRYQSASEDKEFGRGPGLEILVETARLWRGLGHHDLEGRFRIDGVTGPDEYSALGDNNVYTNLMAERNLRAAADAVERFPNEAAALGADAEEAASWRDAAGAMFVPFDEALNVHPQAEGFTHYQVWDFAGTEPEQYPLMLSFPYFDLYRKQVCKQADLVLALDLRGDCFTDDEKARNFEYYEALTVRDSSLSACTQAIVAAEVGHLDLAYDYMGEAGLMDLHDLESNVSDGVHMASLAGVWLASVCGFGGMRDHDGQLSFAPRLPGALEKLAFRLTYRGRLIRVEVTSEVARYVLEEGAELAVSHHGEPITLGPEPIERKVPPVKPRPDPHQPQGRAPAPRSRRGPWEGALMGADAAVKGVTRA
ncbi:MAG TPA: glycosyl hydrolase family 65 protein [Actinomycetota bacterium]|nr:glycosyl hydrolase family 65 protein [Actinomycetota bacterium]